MSTRDSRQSLSSLAVYYADAHVEVFSGKKPYINGNGISKFRVLEDDLRDSNIPLREYAYTVVKILRKWCDDHGFDHVPVNVFCGKWAFGKFMKIWKSETVSIADTKQDGADEMFYSELLVARRFVQQNLSCNRQVRFREVVDELRPLLSKRWLQVYIDRDNDYLRPIDKVLETLCDEYGIDNAVSYVGIVDKWTSTHSIAVSG